MSEREMDGRKTTSHATLRERLSLAVAGALEPEEQVELERHVANCAECAAELDRWRALAGGLKRLPTPQPSPMLVERVRASFEQAAAERVERLRSVAALALLVMFSWTLTLASWPVVRAASNGLASWLDVGVSTGWAGLAWYVVLTWLTAGVAAGMLAWQRQRERRLA
jgi:anti-sigma factor RsiW